MTKRIIDIAVSLSLLLISAPILLICYLIACADTGSNGLFFQKRVGRYGRLFTIYKLKTLHPKTGNISAIGAFFRRYKIDEVPQFFNVLAGSMSLVGPRPDIEGYYDKLTGEARKILELKPGITSLAALKYKQEDSLLSLQPDPQRYNDEHIFPDKVRMNLSYYYNRSLRTDFRILLMTIFPIKKKKHWASGKPVKFSR